MLLLLSSGTGHARALESAPGVDPIGPPPTLPDLGPPPSLPPTDAPVIAPSPTPSPTPPTTAPTPPSSAPAPQRPTTLRPRQPTPVTPTPPAGGLTPSTPTPPAGGLAPTSPAPTSPAIPTPAPPVPSNSPPPTSSPAPPSPNRPAPPPADPDLAAPSIGPAEPEASAAKKGPTVEDLERLERERVQRDRKDPKKWRHGGLIVDLSLGTAFCTRQFCRSSSGHDAAPGLALGGFFGGNVLGILEVGLSAGWNTLRPRNTAGRNAIDLYGLDPALLQQVIADQIGVPQIDLDFSTLNVTSASSRAFNIGPSLRVHFIRKGRGLAYAGAGLHYQLWRNRYSTTGGDARLDFHGISAPFHVGGGAYVHPNIAVVGEFTYALAYFVLGGVDHPQLSSVAPLAAIDDAAKEAGSSLIKGLPHFGKFTVNLRFRF